MQYYKFDPGFMPAVPLYRVDRAIGLAEYWRNGKWVASTRGIEEFAEEEVDEQYLYEITEEQFRVELVKQQMSR